MRKALVATASLGFAAACSPRPEPSGTESAPVAVSDAGAPAATDRAAGFSPPSIAVTAAPGVAFAYRYAFRLPSGKIAKTQEAHAQACEKLGVAHCRITGMRYRLIGENNIEAMLAFKLDPAIARGFGRQAIAAVEAAQGKLVDAEVTGADAASEIKRFDVERARVEEEIARVDRQLADPQRKPFEREELQRRRAELARGRDVAKDGAAEQQASLATTPMTFDYGSGAAVRGFDPSAPLTSAADTAIGSAQITLAVVLGLIAVLGPPALVVLVALLLWRRFGPRRARRPGPAAPS